MKKNKPPTEDQIEAEIKAQARMVKQMDEIDKATPEELDAMIESIPVHNPPDPLEPYGCPSCRNEPCRCLEHRAPHDNCEVCALLGKANYEIHVNDILHGAWKRVECLPIIKSMHPNTRRSILIAVIGA